MSHQDARPSRPLVGHQELRQVVDWLAGAELFGRLRFRRDSTWQPQTLAATALIWVWSEACGLIDRFQTARRITACLTGEQQELATSYQAFLKMLARWGGRLQFVLLLHFRERMQQELRSVFRVAGRVVFGIDGSRIDVPRTATNEAEFSSSAFRGGPPARRARRGPRTRAQHKKASRAQVWLTVLWHVGTGLPWDWRSGPSDASEREHLRQMIDQLPQRSLITGDAGFVGYLYWKALQTAGHDLLIRVGANVKLLRRLGYARERHGLVYLWPDREAARRQPPLVLRLVVLRAPRHPVYLVTTVLSSRDLSDRQLLDLYRRRWGVEVFYRSFKHTFQRRKLRSHTPAHVQLELDWSLLGLWAVCLLAEVHQHAAGISPDRLSVAETLRAIRRTLQFFLSPVEFGHELTRSLRIAVRDPYRRRNKSSRDYPRKKRERPPGRPQIIRASRYQIELARTIRTQQCSKG